VLREQGLAVIRHQNNGRVLEAINAHVPLLESRLLDVGSAHGWFIEAAQERGAQVTGIEPDRVVAALSRVRGAVRQGFFPEVLSAREQFDVITFNDVLEHLTDPAAAVRAAFDHLVPGGLLSINIPDQRGLAFALARLASGLGASGAYERLWQKGLPSPHLWYFDGPALAELGGRCGFRIAGIHRLPSVTREGLWQRVHMDRDPNLISRLQFVAATIFTPLVNLSPFSDIVHIMLVKPRE
jgi:SAM-dependent methyltransferase